MSGTALICVDVQRDFIDGALGAPGRDSVIEPLVKIAKRPDVDVVIASRDWHPSDHCSFSAVTMHCDGAWPPHCRQGTRGADLDPNIVRIVDAVVNKGTDASCEAYSAFDGGVPIGGSRIMLGDVLKGLGITRVIVGGLVLEYCVKETALDAVRAGYETIVPLDATRPLAYSDSKSTIDELVIHGVQVVPSFGSFSFGPFSSDDELELLPPKRRVPSFPPEAFPNTITLDSIEAAVRDRVHHWGSPLEAFLAIAGGVRNWAKDEPHEIRIDELRIT